tara:strand:- start:108 stop:449 length:342 start_codon:yes stop_codon:yes gene_type:complete
MFSWINQSRLVYVLSNLFVLPATYIPFFDFISNISFIVAFILLIKTNFLLLLGLCVVFTIKNNSNYRFNILLSLKGKEISKSDYECVYLYAWCTLLRYSLIGLAANQIFLFFK